MRLSYLIRSISHWFTRVVYQRDEVDLWLARASKSWDLRVGWMLWVARLLVWLSRKVLWLLMMTGHLVSSYLLRQMEFDADRYSARLAGSDAFETTTRRIVELSAAMQIAHSALNRQRQQGVLPDDLARFAIAISGELSPEIRAQLDATLEDSRTGALATHPSHRARIAAAKAEGAEGLLHVDGSAEVLFSNFAALSEKVTASLYRNVFGDAAEGVRRQSFDRMRAEADRAREAHEAIGRYFRGLLTDLRRVPLPTPSQMAAPEGVDPAARLRSLREEIETGRAIHAQQIEAMHEQMGLVLQAAQVAALRDADVLVRAEHIDVPTSSADAARDAGRRARERLAALATDMEPLERKLAARIGLAVEHDRHLARLVMAAGQVDELLEPASDLRVAATRLVVLLQGYPGHEEEETYGSAITRAMEDACDRLEGLRRKARGVELPPGLLLGHGTLEAALGTKSPSRNDPTGIVDAAQACTQRWLKVRFQITGEIARRAERVETSLGLDPAEAVPSDAGSGPAA